MSGINRRPALANSALVDVVRRAMSGSVFFASMRTATNGALGFGSAVSGALRLDRAVERSVAAGIVRWTEAATRASFIYRWLTAEPDPDVIVIDLRDTYTVGPILALLDRLAELLVPASRRSRAISIASRTRGAVLDAPVRAASFLVLVAVITNLALTLAVGDPTRSGIVARAFLLGVATLGTRVTMPWAEFVRTRPISLLVAAFEPPEPAEDRDEPE